jgi:ribonuclease HI
LRTYGGKLGVNTNNAIELHALEEGLRISSTQGISKLIVEGDSQVIINILKRMQHGSPISKFPTTGEWNPSWRQFNKLFASFR